MLTLEIIFLHADNGLCLVIMEFNSLLKLWNSLELDLC